MVEGNMKQQYIKSILIGMLMFWILLFSIDSMFGIDWPNYTMQRIFIWFPTVLIAVYWLIFGGKKPDVK